MLHLTRPPGADWILKAERVGGPAESAAERLETLRARAEGGLRLVLSALSAALEQGGHAPVPVDLVGARAWSRLRERTHEQRERGERKRLVTERVKNWASKEQGPRAHMMKAPARRVYGDLADAAKL